jgi:hypothetical protein
MGRQTSGKHLSPKPYLEVTRINGITYLRLCVAKRRIYLGAMNPEQPAAILETAVRGLDALTIDELKALQRADKSMREGKPKPGPRPKRPPLFGSRI